MKIVVDTNNDALSVVQALVEHYRQPIHAAVPPSELADNRLLQHWLSKLRQSDQPPDYLYGNLLTCYTTCIHPALFSNTSSQTTATTTMQRLNETGILVLQQYWLLLTSYWKDVPNASREESASGVDTDGQRSNLFSLLSDTIQTLASDVARATAGERTKVPTTLLLLRVTTLTLSWGDRLATTTATAKLSTTNRSAWQSANRRCAVAVLAFGVQPCQPRHVHAALQERLSALSPDYLILHESSSAPLLQTTDIRLRAMDWKAVEWTSGTTTNNIDPANIQPVAVLWQQLYKTATSTTDVVFEETRSEKTMQQAVFQTLGTERMATAVRAHFFGRDMSTSSTLANKQPTFKTRLHLGHLVLHPDKATDDPLSRPYQTIPSRVNAALQFISLLDAVTLQILNEILPVCYELLTGAGDAVRALGAAGLYHLLTCRASPPNLWSQVVNSGLLLPPLDLACKTSRHGPALAVIGLAQAQVFRVVQLHDFAKAQQLRRQATQHWLLTLHQNSVREGNPVLWGILVGAILPLLKDHVETQNADALELGRLGLTALLPLLQTEDDSQFAALDQASGNEAQDRSYRSEIRLLATVALGQLLVAAHPIMPRHGGKIATALAACMGHCTDPQELTVIQHVAARALVVCGARAGLMWSSIANGNDLDSSNKFDARLSQLAKQVDQEATALRARYETVINVT